MLMHSSIFYMYISQQFFMQLFYIFNFGAFLLGSGDIEAPNMNSFLSKLVLND
jgi:hypothetical protein